MLDKIVNGVASAIIYSVLALLALKLLLYGPRFSNHGFACNDFYCLIDPVDFFGSFLIQLFIVVSVIFFFAIGYRKGFEYVWAFLFYRKEKNKINK